MEPSNKMKKFVRQIEETLSIKFEGDRKSFDDVHSFIDQHVGEWKIAKDNAPPSEKQSKGIKLIEDTLHVTFEGKTQKEASEFIGEYLADAINNKKE